MRARRRPERRQVERPRRDLDPAPARCPPRPASGRRPAGRAAPIELSATLGNGDEITLEASPPRSTRGSGPAVPVLFLPASLRCGRLLDGPTARRRRRESRNATSTCGRAGPRRRRPRRCSPAVDELCRARRARTRAADRGARAVPAPTGAALPLPAAQDVRRGRQPGALLDPRAGLPERRPPGRAGAGRAQPPHRHASRPARAARRPARASARSASSTPSVASCSSPAPCCSSRGAPRS